MDQGMRWNDYDRDINLGYKSLLKIPSLYNCGEKRSILKSTVQNMSNIEAFGLQQHRSHEVPLLSAKNINICLQARRSPAVKDWKNEAWSAKSWFLLRLQMVGSNFGINSLNPTCLQQTAQAAGGASVSRMFSFWAPRWSLNHCVNVTAYRCWPHRLQWSPPLPHRNPIENLRTGDLQPRQAEHYIVVCIWQVCEKQQYKTAGGCVQESKIQRIVILSGIQKKKAEGVMEEKEVERKKTAELDGFIFLFYKNLILEMNLTCLLPERWFPNK